ncbi:hypothetical protein Cgig2_004684 [Carnegiea gigantea]|uniref:Uncharacterized protein n=1 Tax=Carnegiea gigantea TaxID=171969 RepID=A0A9Q1JT52_9CARY|nr:hypothetical protein Cgig2_004684 [Carnegiea gigantea]
MCHPYTSDNGVERLPLHFCQRIAAQPWLLAAAIAVDVGTFGMLTIGQRWSLFRGGLFMVLPSIKSLCARLIIMSDSLGCSDPAVLPAVPPRAGARVDSKWHDTGLHQWLVLPLDEVMFYRGEGSDVGLHELFLGIGIMWKTYNFPVFLLSENDTSILKEVFQLAISCGGLECFTFRRLWADLPSLL